MNENRKALLGFISLLIIGGLILVLVPKKNTASFRRTKLLLDTYVTITVEAPPSEASRAVNEAFSRMKQVENKLNRYGPKSEIAQINRKAPKPVVVSHQTLEAVQLGLKYSKLTKGRFDITVGPLVSLFNFSHKKVPSEREVNKAKQLVGFHMVKIDRFHKAIALSKKGMILDLGGLAKGLAADEAYKVLARHKIKSGLIDTGSSTLAFSKDKGGRIWKIGIRHPRQDSILAVIKVRNNNISTSGDYQQYFIKSGKRYHHIINPKTGYPAKGFVSTTIISKKSAAETDILSTALFTMRPMEAKAFLQTLPFTEAVLVDQTGSVIVTDKKLVDLPKKISLR